MCSQDDVRQVPECAQVQEPHVGDPVYLGGCEIRGHGERCPGYDPENAVIYERVITMALKVNLGSDIVGIIGD